MVIQGLAAPAVHQASDTLELLSAQEPENK